jgi:hypothetical protein
MAQFGLNTGPRHARCVGWCVSYTKTLSEEVMVMHDTEIIGAVSIIYQIVKAHLPAEIGREMETQFSDYKLPHTASRRVAPGQYDNIFVSAYTDFTDQVKGIILSWDQKSIISTARRGGPLRHICPGALLRQCYFYPYHTMLLNNGLHQKNSH